MLLSQCHSEVATTYRACTLHQHVAAAVQLVGNPQTEGACRLSSVMTNLALVSIYLQSLWSFSCVCILLRLHFRHAWAN